MQPMLFEAGRSEWDLHVAPAEMRRVQTMTAALVSRSVPFGVVWVKRVGPGTRRWYIEGFKCRAFIDTAGSQNDPHEPVAIPLHFLDHCVEVAEAFGNAVVFLNERENVFTCHAGDEYHVMDAPEVGALMSGFDPVEEYADIICDPGYRSAVVRTDLVERIANGYHRMANSIPDFTMPYPMMDLEITPTTVHWTTDWSRWGRPAVSGIGPATSDDIGTVTTYPPFLWTFVEVLLFEDEMTLGFTDSHTVLSGLDWSIWVENSTELELRWSERADKAFDELGFEHVKTEYKSELRNYMNDDLLISLTLLDGVAGSDCLQLIYAFDIQMAPTYEMLLEIMRLNVELTNARVVVSENSVVITVDIDNPRSHDQFTDGIKAMLVAIGRCAGLQEFLPLFAGSETDEPAD